MCQSSTVLLLCCTMPLFALCQVNTNRKPSPVSRGTINVVVANDNGIVVLADSLLTSVWQDGNGLHSQQAGNSQKLFQIDDKTVCAFAGFASAPTPAMPDFLNSMSSIIGRLQYSLKHFRNIEPLSFSDKLDLLEDVAGYYFTGIENIREQDPADVYMLELFLIGYDTDETPVIATLTLRTVSEPGPAGPFLRSVVLESDKRIFPVPGHQMICVHGIDEVAKEMLDGSNLWKPEPSGACRQSLSEQRRLSVDEMKALAISLKQHTSEKHKEVGGPNQIAVLARGRILSFEQPISSQVILSDFKFRVISTMILNGGMPGNPRTSGFVSDADEGFTLFFANQFIHERLDLADGYFGKNAIKDSVIVYRGGKPQFERSNTLTDCDLEVAKGLSPDSPGLKQLLHDFKWRSVSYGVNVPPRR